ncbi:MAG: pyridoxal phosphate-dependent aminotransferase [Chloroflexaceae bacterium]|nr:pyridoxal phosphate-dependent aminotransferase [Chloroflexaceae bacterium]
MGAGCFATLDLTPNRIELARQQAAALPGYLDLTSSNPTHQGLLFPPDILRGAADAYWATRRYHPDPHGLPVARAAIAHTYAARTPSLLLPEEAIFLTASTSEAYGLLFALLADPGDNLLAPNVTYPLFDYLAEIHHIELRPYRLDESRGWQIDEDDLRRQVDHRSRAVLIISPHNPTGAVLRGPLPVLNAVGLPLIGDEVFAPFPYRVPSVPPIAALHPDLPVFQLHGISKMFALPDLKLGWVALNGPAHQTYGERLELLNDTFLGASGLIQAMLPTLFAQGMTFVDAMRDRIRANLDDATERFSACPSLTLKPPDGGYYLFPRVHGWDNEEDLVLFLLDRGVLVHPGYFYGEVPGTHIMLSALTEPARFAAGVERICAALDGEY